jgi:predicted dehydrogenase
MRSPRPHRRRLLLVGFGQRGRQWHEACRRRKDVVVAGVVDPDPAAQEAARSAGLQAWSTIEEARRLGSVEAAIVASPPWEHACQALECLSLGMPGLVEKPFTLSLEDAARVASESARLGIPLAVAQNFRFLRRERAVRKALAHDVGRPLSASIVSARPASAAMPHLASVEHGAVWDICLHHLDAIVGRFGGAPATVSMTASPIGGGAAAHTLFQLQLEWRGGPTVVYTHSEGARGFRHSEWMECELRAVVVENQTVSLVFPRHSLRRVSVPRGPQPENAVLDDFLGAMQTGDVPALGAGDNLATIATVAAAVRSETLGRPVTVAEIGQAAGIALEVGSEAR